MIHRKVTSNIALTSISSSVLATIGDLLVLMSLSLLLVHQFNLMRICVFSRFIQNNNALKSISLPVLATISSFSLVLMSLSLLLVHQFNLMRICVFCRYIQYNAALFVVLLPVLTSSGPMGVDVKGHFFVLNAVVVSICYQ